MKNLYTTYVVTNFRRANSCKIILTRSHLELFVLNSTDTINYGLKTLHNSYFIYL